VSRGAQLAISIAISAVALWYCFHDSDLRGLALTLSSARWSWIAAMAGITVVTMWLRAMRWKVLLGTVGPVGDAPVISATCIGFMGNMVLPLRAGEAIRPLVVSRGGRISMPAALATVAIDRLMDLVMLGVFASLTLLLVPASETLRTAARGVVIVVLLGVLALVAIILASDWIESRATPLVRKLPETLARIAEQGMHGFLGGVRGLRDVRTLAAVLAYSTAIWLTVALMFATGALALRIEAPLIPLGFAATVIVAAFVSAPSAPGFLGVYQAGSEIALKLFDVHKNASDAFGILTWAVQMVVIVALGMWCLARLNLSLGEMAAKAESVEPTA